MDQASMSVSESIKAAARGWVVRLSDDRTAQTRAEFEDWLSQNPAHVDAYGNALQVWDAVGELRHLAQLEDCSLPAPWHARARSWLSERVDEFVPSLRWPRAGFASAAALVSVVAVALVFFRNADVTQGERHATEIAQIRDVQLPDGSTITIGARSSVETRFTASERRVILHDGEAVFEVAHDTARPFIVVADDILVRAVGTRFDVHRGSNQVRVTVIEGAVDVVEDRITNLLPGVREARAKRVRGGEQITTLDHAELNEVQAAGVADFPAWRDGILRYQDASLAEVVADANRYFRGEIQLGTAEIAALRITTSFGTSQIEQFVNSLPDVLPVRIDRPAAGRIVVQPTHGSEVARAE